MTKLLARLQTAAKITPLERINGIVFWLARPTFRLDH